MTQTLNQGLTLGHVLMDGYQPRHAEGPGKIPAAWLTAALRNLRLGREIAEAEEHWQLRWRRMIHAVFAAFRLVLRASLMNARRASRFPSGSDSSPTRIRRFPTNPAV